MRTERGGRRGRRAHSARYSGVYQCHAFWFRGTVRKEEEQGVTLPIRVSVPGPAARGTEENCYAYRCPYSLLVRKSGARAGETQSLPLHALRGRHLSLSLLPAQTIPTAPGVTPSSFLTNSVAQTVNGNRCSTAMPNAYFCREDSRNLP